jgi:hypothetical protein
MERHSLLKQMETKAHLAQDHSNTYSNSNTGSYTCNSRAAKEEEETERLLQKNKK